MTRDPPPSKAADKVEFSWTSIKEKPLKLFWILTEFQANRAERLAIFPAKVLISSHFKQKEKLMFAETVF